MREGHRFPHAPVNSCWCGCGRGGRAAAGQHMHMHMAWPTAQLAGGRDAQWPHAAPAPRWNAERWEHEGLWRMQLCRGKPRRPRRCGARWAADRWQPQFARRSGRTAGGCCHVGSGAGRSDRWCAAIWGEAVCSWCACMPCMGAHRAHACPPMDRHSSAASAAPPRLLWGPHRKLELLTFGCRPSSVV